MSEIQTMIKDLEFKIEALPEKIFIEYIEEDFLPKIKEFATDYIQNEIAIKKLQKIIDLIYKKCQELADTYPVAQFQDEIKNIIGDKQN